MHILVTNDDGPPCLQSSPYIHPFISALESAGHIVSVVLPHQQRSWIGKAHFVSQLVRPHYYVPGEDPYSGGEGSTTKASQDVGDWAILDSTPATCTQLGLFHLFQSKPPIDVVVSGPNYGKNVTALFSLSSGTLGGALEAATFRYRAVALSFAFWSRAHDPALIGPACKHAVRLVEHLTDNWGESVDLYSVNVPLVKGVDTAKVYLTPVLDNRWRSGSSFEEVSTDDVEEDAEDKEKVIRENREKGVKSANGTGHERRFRWKPTFADVQASIDESEEGNDGWAVTKGCTSITPLKANFMHAKDVEFGELKLHGSPRTESPILEIAIEVDEYISSLISPALAAGLKSNSFRILPCKPHSLPTNGRTLQILPYEQIDFSRVLHNSKTSLANAYVIRKALIRKHHLWQTISTWWTKHPDDTALKGHIPLTVTFELDYAEFLDEALLECWELTDSFAKQDKEWWILKPSMSDQGQGIRLFNSEAGLREIFEEWEEGESEEEEVDEERSTSLAMNDARKDGAKTMTSQLRHFIAQRYVEKPLLFTQYGDRKFHIRSYVLAVGALKVYLYKDMLALFARQPYSPDPYLQDAKSIPEVHLTNTCLQSDKPKDNTVIRFWDLPAVGPLPHHSWKDHAVRQIEAATSALFEAAAREQMVHFQALPNAFEVFGVDWLVDETGNVWLLEVNCFPDFKQSGNALKGLVQGFWTEVIRIAVGGFFGIAAEVDDEESHMVDVLDIDLGRRIGCQTAGIVKTFIGQLNST